MNREDVYEITKELDNVFYYSNGTLMPNNKNYEEIIITDDTIYTIENDAVRENKDKTKIDELWKIITVYTGAIIELSEKNRGLEHSKATFNDEITLKMNDKYYKVSNMVDDEQTNRLYKNIVDKIVSNL